MRRTNEEKTTRATVTGSDGLFPFQATENSPLSTSPQGGRRGAASAFSQSSFVALTRPLANETLTEIDRIAAFATQLDALLAGVEEETIRTVAIHLFVQLTGNSDAVDIAKLSAQTGLSVRQVKRTLYTLTLTGKTQRLHGTNPRRYKLLIEGGTA